MALATVLPTSTPSPVPTLAATPSPSAAATRTLTRIPTIARSTVDRPDDSDGYQVHLLYVLPSDAPDELLDTDGTILTSATAANNWFKEQTGARLRFDTFQGALDITFVRLNRTDAQYNALGPTRGQTIRSDLNAIGFKSPRKIYAMYYGGAPSGLSGCGQS